MDIIRSFSIEKSQQDDFEQGFQKMIQEFVQRLPRMEKNELAKDSQCVICQNEYRLETLNTDSVEEAVRLPCGHHAGRKCIATWLKPKHGDSCPMCRKRFFQIVPWPQIITDKDWDETKYYIPTFDDICMTIFRSDYNLQHIGAGPRGDPFPGWIVRAAGRSSESNKHLVCFFQDYQFGMMFARKILSTSPPEA